MHDRFGVNDSASLYDDYSKHKNSLFINYVKIDKPIGNLYRKNHILILVQDKHGSFILGKKQNFYADGMSRMLGGGLKDNENPKEAAKREILEETGLCINKDDFFSLGRVITKADTSEGIMFMNVHLFGLVLDEEKTINPNDDISDIKIYSRAELEKMIDNMYHLKGEFRNDDFYFLHNDWGRIYGYIHEIALNNFCRHEKNLLISQASDTLNQ